MHSDWNLCITGSLVALIDGKKGPRDFADEFEEQGLIGPNARNWSSVVRVVRGWQDMGTVTQFKDDNDIVQYKR